MDLGFWAWLRPGRSLTGKPRWGDCCAKQKKCLDLALRRRDLGGVVVQL